MSEPRDSIEAMARAGAAAVAEHTEETSNLRADLARVTEERNRLQRACDEGLPRERLTCPHCGALHVDGADGTEYGKRPHHTHLCQPDNGGCGRTFDTGRWSYGADVPADAAAQELDAAEDLAIRLGKILGGVALALKGEPPPLTTHSTHDLAEVARAVVLERDALHTERNIAHTKGRADGLREALDACGDVKEQLLDAAMDGGGPINCREAFGEEDPFDADGGECELIAAGASLCAEAIEALIAKGGGA